MTSETRTTFLSYAAVAAVALALGAGATYWTLCSRWDRPTDATAIATAGGQAGRAAPPPLQAETPSGPPPSDQAVFIASARQQLIGVRTSEVSARLLQRTIRTVGVLAYDETRVAEIHTKVAGWVESVGVDFVGKTVRKGEPLFRVYSPDLVATQNEYLLALKAQAELGESRSAETRQGAASLLAAARERLRLWDVTDAQVAELERSREPRRTLTLYSPFDGTVLERRVFPGQYVTPEMSTLRVVDLSTIWVLGQIFEYEQALVKVGQSAEVLLSYGRSDRALAGRVTFIYPDVDPMTRRIKVRIELANPGLEFKPESYVTVLLRAGAGSQLAVPREAVLDDGSRRYAIRALPGGYFEPRTIEVGDPVDDYYPVLSGLARGDRVVTSAQFLIDSETNLQAALQGMTAAPVSGSRAGVDPPAASEAAPASLSITFRSEPDPPRVGANLFEVVVRDAEGRPVTDATVAVTFFMPAMPAMGMPAMRSQTGLAGAGNGVYRATGQVTAAGRWDVTVTVSRAGRPIGSRRLAVVVQ